MNNKICEKCGKPYDNLLDKCPNCNNNEFNINNPFLNYNNEIKEEKEQVTNNIIENKQEDLKNIEEKKIEDNTSSDISLVDINNIEVNKDNNSSILFTPENSEEEKPKEEKNVVVKKKKNKEHNYFAYLLLVEGLILLFITSFGIVINCPIAVIIHYLLTSFSLLIAFYLINKKIKIGYYLAILASLSMVFMINEVDYINFVIGVYLSTTSIINLAKIK